jgi:hypothetical protein
MITDNVKKCSSVKDMYKIWLFLLSKATKHNEYDSYVTGYGSIMKPEECNDGKKTVEPYSIVWNPRDADRL